MAVNDDQIAYWNGQTGEKWARFQARMDANLLQASQAVLALARRRVEAAVAQSFAARQKARGDLRLDMTCWCVSARG